MKSLNILFIYYDAIEGDWGTYHEGIATMAAILKGKGHSVSLFHIVNDMTADEVADVYSRQYSDTDIIACSITELSLGFYRDCLKRLRSDFQIYSVCGGPVATLCPERVMAEECFDALCRGDGEESFAELCSQLAEGVRPTDIAGFWFKAGDDIIQNPIRPVIKEISKFPMPDRSIFDMDKIEEYRCDIVPVMAARGCPFNCSFCCNHALKNVLPNKKDYIRYKDKDRLVEEIKIELERCRKLGKKIKSIRFYDDLLIANKKWFAEFAEIYRREIALPFSCNCRFELLDDEILRELKDSGCFSMQLGLETGNEKLRKQALNRNQPNEMVIAKSKLIHKWGIKFHVYTMVGIPEEDMASALQTVKFSASIQADSMQVSVLYPFWGTELEAGCVEKGYIKNKTVENYMEGKSVLELPTLTNNQIGQVHSNFHPFYNLYKRLYRMPVLVHYIPEKILDIFWYNYSVSWPVRVFYRFMRRFKSLR